MPLPLPLLPFLTKHTPSSSPPWWQVRLGPVDCASEGAREAIEGLPSTLGSLALLPDLLAFREGDEGGWRMRLPGKPVGVPAVQQLCTAFDRPGLPCVLEGQVALSATFPAVGTSEALGAYLGQCTEVAGRLRGGTTSGVVLTLAVDDAGSGADDGAAAGGAAEVGGGFLGRVLGAVLPAAAPHVHRLELRPQSCAFTPGFSRHLAAPGLAFPRLERLGLVCNDEFRCMDADDVAALARVTAPRLTHVELLMPTFGSGAEPSGGVIHSSPGVPCTTELAIMALALGLPRPVDAEGRPTHLRIELGCRRLTAGSGSELAGALWALGRHWLHVNWCVGGGMGRGGICMGSLLGGRGGVTWEGQGCVQGGHRLGSVFGMNCFWLVFEGGARRHRHFD
jgi:hypothetical protein